MKFPSPTCVPTVRCMHRLFIDNCNSSLHALTVSCHEVGPQKTQCQPPFCLLSLPNEFVRRHRLWRERGAEGQRDTDFGPRTGAVGTGRRGRPASVTKSSSSRSQKKPLSLSHEEVTNSWALQPVSTSTRSSIAAQGKGMSKLMRHCGCTMPITPITWPRKRTLAHLPSKKAPSFASTIE